jgi:hypothetical protein
MFYQHFVTLACVMNYFTWDMYLMQFVMPIIKGIPFIQRTFLHMQLGTMSTRYIFVYFRIMWHHLRHTTGRS